MNLAVVQINPVVFHSINTSLMTFVTLKARNNNLLFFEFTQKNSDILQ